MATLFSYTAIAWVNVWRGEEWGTHVPSNVSILVL